MESMTCTSLYFSEKANSRSSLLECWSGRADSNRGPLAPKASALPGCATPRMGVNNHFAKLGELCPACFSDLCVSVLAPVHRSGRISPRRRGI